jgi:hypothetical protein
MRIATETADFQISVAGIEGIPERGGGLPKALCSRASASSGFAGELVN